MERIGAGLMPRANPEKASVSPVIVGLGHGLEVGCHHLADGGQAVGVIGIIRTQLAAHGVVGLGHLHRHARQFDGQGIALFGGGSDEAGQPKRHAKKLRHRVLARRSQR